MSATVRMAAHPAACLPHLAKALRHAVIGEGGTAAELVDGCAVFELVDNGRTVGAFALQVIEASDGRVIRCAAAGGDPGHDLTGDMVRFVEREARQHVEAAALVCETKRPGLVRRLRREGFRVAGYILRKDLT